VVNPDYLGPYYLWRLLIDQRYQGRGYGSAALRLAVEHVCTREDARVLITSVGQGPSSPVGFREVGMNDLRDRALRAAREQAEQREREATKKAEAQRQYEERLIAEAEALCEQTLGVKAKFHTRPVYHPDGGIELGKISVYTVIEGVSVEYHPADGHYYQEPTLSHDLARLGAEIQEREDAARQKREREAHEAAEKAVRTCDWCGEVVPRVHGSDRSLLGAEAVAWHKKFDHCHKRRWWRV
jgi:hypothetical protein